MRKILVSSGFGAGWTSWHSGDREQVLFMLEYPPFVEFLENGGEFEEKSWRLNHKEPWESFEEPGASVVRQFCTEWEEKFGDASFPYFGGLNDCYVVTIPDNVGVRIAEYDGNESYVLQDAEEYL